MTRHHNAESAINHSVRSGEIVTINQINRALLAEANREYVRTVAVASNSRMPADGRRVLGTEHCALKSAMDSYRRRADHSALRARIDECVRTRALWT